jgi:uncharacterized membrane protein YraQ (UPF0718 family)
MPEPCAHNAEIFRALLVSWAAVLEVAMIVARLVLASACAAILGMVVPAGAQSLDYEVFKTRVEPIFLKKRPTHARCVVCHAGATNAFHLQPLDKGATTWTEEESRKNFETVSRLVKPGDPDNSHFLKQPLAHEAGGEEFHSGGRQFTNKDDPDWKTIADWVRAAK